MADSAYVASLDRLKEIYGKPPDDLALEMRGSKLLLHSDGKIVEMAVPFGVVSWDDVLYRYVLPALARLLADGTKAHGR